METFIVLLIVLGAVWASIVLMGHKVLRKLHENEQIFEQYKQRSKELDARKEELLREREYLMKLLEAEKSKRNHNI